MINREVVCIGVCVFAVGLCGIGRAQPIPAPRVVIDRYCTTCHNDKARLGGLSLSNLTPESAGERPDVWEKVVRKMRVRFMPPDGLPRPDERTYDATVASIEAALDR